MSESPIMKECEGGMKIFQLVLSQITGFEGFLRCKKASSAVVLSNQTIRLINYRYYDIFNLISNVRKA